MTDRETKDLSQDALAMFLNLLDSKATVDSALADSVRRYPEQARLLAEAAALRVDLVAAPHDNPQTTVLIKSATKRAALSAKPPPLTSLVAGLALSGIEKANLYSGLRIGKSVLDKLERRSITPASIPHDLLAKLADAIFEPIERVADYLTLPPGISFSSGYRGDAAPLAGKKQSFEAALRTSLQIREIGQEDYDYWIALPQAGDASEGL